VHVTLTDTDTHTGSPLAPALVMVSKLHVIAPTLFLPLRKCSGVRGRAPYYTRVWVHLSYLYITIYF